MIKCFYIVSTPTLWTEVRYAVVNIVIVLISVDIIVDSAQAVNGGTGVDV